jgi:hypothetical protein
MLANGTVHSDSYRWWLTIGRPTRLIRADRARAIDRIIDYFGGGGGHPAATARLETLDAPGREAQGTGRDPTAEPVTRTRAPAVRARWMVEATGER